jgi:hypothetical protein
VASRLERGSTARRTGLKYPEGTDWASGLQQTTGGGGESTELRDFKTRARALPEDERAEAFQSDEFRQLIAQAAVPAVVAEAECATHCFSHCGSHCFGHG